MKKTWYWAIGSVAQVLLGCGAEDVDLPDDIGSIEQSVKFTNGLIDYNLISSANKYGANSTAAIVRDSTLASCNASYCTLRTRSSLMCPMERFAEQSSLPGACTGFLVGARQIATAGHCFDPGRFACNATSIVFHWRKDTGAAANPNILREHIYHCASIVADGRAEGQDWVIIELDRDVTTSDVTPRGPLTLATRPTSVGTRVGVPQHFAALPMKYNEGPVTDLPSLDPNAIAYLKSLRAEVEVTGGSSGAPWIDVSTGQVVGILSKSPVEMQEIDETDPAATCIKEKISCFTNPGSCANNRPQAVPAWLIRKGSREFSIFSTQSARPSGTPLVGDFDGDSNGDIFWFNAGSSAHVFWWGNGQGGFTPTSFTLSTTGVPFVLDMSGDGMSDLCFYGPGTGKDECFRGRPDRVFYHSSFTVADVGLIPVAGDFDGNGYDDVFWYNPGSAADSIWFFRSGTAPDGTFRKSYTVTSYTISDTGLVPTAGDYDSDGRADILWFDPTGANDRVWYSYQDANGANRFQSVGVAASFSGATPFTGDFDGDSRSDVLWFTPNVASATLWSGTNQRGNFGSKTVTIPAAPTVTRGQDFDRDSVDDLILSKPSGFTILAADTWAH